MQRSRRRSYSAITDFLKDNDDDYGKDEMLINRKHEDARYVGPILHVAEQGGGAVVRMVPGDALQPGGDGGKEIDVYASAMSLQTPDDFFERSKKRACPWEKDTKRVGEELGRGQEVHAGESYCGEETTVLGGEMGVDVGIMELLEWKDGESGADVNVRGYQGRGLDYDAAPAVVMERIEQVVLWCVTSLSEGKQPEISLPEANGAGSRGTVTWCQQSKRKRFAALWAVLDICHQNLMTHSTRTQRDVYYTVKSKMPAIHHAQVTIAIQDAIHLLQVPRYKLGVTCSSKGIVSGPLVVRFGGGGCDEGSSVSCSALISPQGVHIPGNVDSILNMDIKSIQATSIVVVEKDTVFQRLVSFSKMEERLKGCLFVTGRGVPDIATRAFLFRLHSLNQSLPVVGLVDWNPWGALILKTYRFGSTKMAEASKFVLPSMRWLGLRHQIIKSIPNPRFEAMSNRDYSMCEKLRDGMEKHDSAWAEELDCMCLARLKADIEATYSDTTIASFGALVATAVENHSWI